MKITAAEARPYFDHPTHATPDDMPRLLEMMRAFHERAGLPFGFDEDAVAAFLCGLMDGGVVIMTPHGMIGGLVTSPYCDPKWKIAVELFWWADRGGMALLRAFEKWAKDAGVNEMRMTSLESLPRASAILWCKGYVATEISYSKVI